MNYKRERLDELISDLLVIICSKGAEASKYAELAGRSGRYQDVLAKDLASCGLNAYEAKRFLSSIGFLLLPSINSLCKEKCIEITRPHSDAIFNYEEDIKKEISKGIDRMPSGSRAYLEEIADKAVYLKRMNSKSPD